MLGHLVLFGFIDKPKVLIILHVYVYVYLLFNITFKDISVIYVTAHRCSGGLKNSSQKICLMFYCYQILLS